MTMKEIEAKTVTELKALAKKAGIIFKSEKKAEIIAKLSKLIKKPAAKAKKPAASAAAKKTSAPKTKPRAKKTKTKAEKKTKPALKKPAQKKPEVKKPAVKKPTAKKKAAPKEKDRKPAPTAKKPKVTKKPVVKKTETKKKPEKAEALAASRKRSVEKIPIKKADVKGPEATAKKPAALKETKEEAPKKVFTPDKEATRGTAVKGRIREKAEEPPKLLENRPWVTHPVLPSKEAPSGYGKDMITVLTLEPKRIFVYWEMTGEHKGRLNIRVYDVTGVGDPSEATGFFDIAAPAIIGSTYINVLADREYIVDIGIKTGKGFAARARSTRTSMPLHRPKKGKKAEGAVLPKEYYDFLPHGWYN